MLLQQVLNEQKSQQVEQAILQFLRLLLLVTEQVLQRLQQLQVEPLLELQLQQKEQIIQLLN
ncbi:hypothetical protein CBD41_08710 [bacterium TMED181]|nr:MAG: hypothetical protein CBD41_08710 [bacterium TMED181]